MKRIFDVLASLLVLFIGLPFLVLIALLVALDSKGGVFYRQERIGKNGVPFGMLKFRTMAVGADKSGKLTIGSKDSRITRAGFWLRKYKVDEFPQLINILKGEMSVVGPRPETPNFVALYTEKQRMVLSIRPGLTDYASIQYVDESELLAAAANPEKKYIEEVMPDKLRLNLEYINEQSLTTDLKIIVKTISRIFGR